MQVLKFFRIYFVNLKNDNTSGGITIKICHFRFIDNINKLKTDEKY